MEAAGSVKSLEDSSSVIRLWNDFSHSHRKHQGPAQKSDARKTAGPSNRALIRCVIFVRGQASLERRVGGSEAQRTRSEPITGP
jgi:hypothetical protein